MGDDPKTSVLNKNCQAHDVKNLFVADGASFCYGSGQEPDAQHHGTVVENFRILAGSGEKRGDIACLSVHIPA